MKTFSLFFLSIALLVPVSLAGNFGPAPFRNGSPLVSGVDGTYQATARAVNVTGIFRFAYSGGSQTTSTAQNSWTFFVNGQLQRGQVVSSIDQSNLDGIFDSALGGSTTNSTTAISLPYITLNQNNSSLGRFSGKLNLKNPNAAFSGSGTLLPNTAQTNSIVGISQNQASAFSFNGTVPPTAFAPGAIIVTTNTFITQAGSITPVEFKFRGVRTSTSSSSTTSTNTTSN